MTIRFSAINPRGWAIVSLAGGALLASPFLRPSHLRPQRLESPAEESFVAAASPFGSMVDDRTSWPDTLTTAANPQQLPLPSASGWDVRTVTGPLPSTTALPQTQLPDWVQTPSQLDRLMARSERDDSYEEAMSRAEAVLKEKPREFRAWRSPAPTEGSRERPVIAWTAPQAQPGYRPFAAQVAPTSPWTVEATTEPAPISEHALASKQWPDDTMMSEVEKLVTSGAVQQGERSEGNRFNRLTAGGAEAHESPMHQLSWGSSAGRAVFPPPAVEDTGQLGSRSLRRPAITAQPKQSPAPESTGDRSRFVYQPGLSPVDGK